MKKLKILILQKECFAADLKMLFQRLEHNIESFFLFTC